MNAEIKQEWIAALRSGKYKQGMGKLRMENDAYCCLGVLCEIAVKHNVIPPGVLHGISYRYGTDGSTSQGCLPPAVTKWSGVSAFGYYGEPLKFDEDHVVAVTHDLANDNDNHRKTFAEIADIIEANF